MKIHVVEVCGDCDHLYANLVCGEGKVQLHQVEYYCGVANRVIKSRKVFDTTAKWCPMTEFSKQCEKAMKNFGLL